VGLRSSDGWQQLATRPLLRIRQPRCRSLGLPLSGGPGRTGPKESLTDFAAVDPGAWTVRGRTTLGRGSRSCLAAWCNLWRNNYFLNPLKEVVVTLKAA
jgi:hypothetical protein